MTTVQEMVVDETKVKKAIQSGIPLTITTFTLPRAIEIYIEQVLTVFLKHLEEERLKDYIIYCIQELAGNAKKANTKRAYFMERGLDLSDPDDYKEGMAGFKEQTLGNIAHYLRLQKEMGLYIKFILQMKNNTIYIEVRNNVALNKTELIRIHDKLVRSRQFNNLDEVMAQVFDDSEGAGLGLVILVLMLKKMGLDEDCFDMYVSDRETIARLIIPLDKTRIENLSALSNLIVDSVNPLPQLPENIVSLQKLIADPKTEMAGVIRQVSMDPALTAELLKAANSGRYTPGTKAGSVSEAVKLAGIQGISDLLMAYDTQKIPEDAHKKTLWNHSYKTAFFAFNLAKNFRSGQKLSDDAYIGGILHDMGKIIFSGIQPDMMDNIKGFCSEKGLPASTLEDISAGMIHAEIGAAAADKWNFPADLTACIRYHHDPASAPREYRDLVDIVYLANMLCEIESGDVSYDQLDPSTLESFGVNSETQIDSLMKMLAAGFGNEDVREQQ